eukprot:gene12146-5637_t
MFTAGYNFLLSIFLYIVGLFKGLWRTFSGNNVVSSRDTTLTDERKFLHLYEMEFGAKHPKFFDGTFKEAVNTAKTTFKPLCVYIHSIDEHLNTPEFCKKVLNSEGFSDFINQNFIFYGIDISSKQGHQLSYQLKATSYPFLAIICVIKSKNQVVKTFEGDINEIDLLIGNLIEVQESIEAQLIIEKEEENYRSLGTRQREEQDRIFKEIQEKDLQKQKEKEEKEKREKEEKQKEEIRIKEQQQLAQLKQKQKIQNLKNVKVERENLKKNFPLEPESSSKQTTLIKFKFPNGSQIERRFSVDDKNLILYQFIHILDESKNSWFPKESSNLEHYELITSFPKKKLNPNETLKESNCVPNQTIFVRDTNESSDDDESDDEETIN